MKNNMVSFMQKRLKEAKNKKGFTLVEIIVVLVILAVLLAITVPGVTGYIDEANNAKYLAEARSVYIVAEGERVRDIAKGSTNSEGDWNGTATTIADKSGVDVSSVSYTSGVYTLEFTATDGKTVTVEVTVNGSMEVK